jgi:hypothetical protein
MRKKITLFFAFAFLLQCVNAQITRCTNSNFYTRSFIKGTTFTNPACSNEISVIKNNGFIHAYDLCGLYRFSDVRLKTNIIDTKLNGLEMINKLRVVDFNWLADPGGIVSHGFIAQECQLVYPDMIGQVDSLLAISLDYLIPILVKAVQQQTKQVDSLKEIITEQALRITILTGEVNSCCHG